MRYLKIFEAYTASEIKSTLEDILLELNDYGFISVVSMFRTSETENIEINISLPFKMINKEYSYPVYHLWYDHDKSQEEYDYVNRFEKGDIDISKIVYIVNIFPKSGYNYDSDLSVELSSRVKLAYPEINVII